MARNARQTRLNAEFVAEAQARADRAIAAGDAASARVWLDEVAIRERIVAGGTPYRTL